MRRQFLPVDNCESMRDREVTSNQRKTSMMREAFEKSFFAAHAAKPFAGVRPVSWAGWRFQGSIRLSAAENLLLLPDSESDKVIDVVEHRRRNKNQAVEPVENAAMSRNEF